MHAHTHKHAHTHTQMHKHAHACTPDVKSPVKYSKMHGRQTAKPKIGWPFAGPLHLCSGWPSQTHLGPSSSSSSTPYESASSARKTIRYMQPSTYVLDLWLNVLCMHSKAWLAARQSFSRTLLSQKSLCFFSIFNETKLKVAGGICSRRLRHTQHVHNYELPGRTGGN
jgi:hypothetical protein